MPGVGAPPRGRPGGIAGPPGARTMTSGSRTGRDREEEERAMTHLEDAGLRTMVVAMLALGALLLGARSARIVAGALRHARALDLIRGIRVGILAFVAG